MIAIPLADQNSFVVEASLEGNTYFLRLDWNSEAGLWVLGLQDARTAVVLQGVALVPGSPLLGQFRHLGVPPGEFMVHRQDDSLSLGRDSFRDAQATLYYMSEAEYAAL
ncbi:MAG TPA: hypothetical protein PLP85_13610 [Alcaligenes sp.]|nr:hypothetical protein [Alcaligenes sp.]